MHECETKRKETCGFDLQGLCLRNYVNKSQNPSSDWIKIGLLLQNYGKAADKVIFNSGNELQSF